MDLNLTQSQIQTISLKMQESLNILQMTNNELVEEVKAQLEKNPVLEEDFSKKTYHISSEKKDFFMENQVVPETLSSHLENQCVFFEEDKKIILNYLINDLDEHGFLSEDDLDTFYANFGKENVENCRKILFGLNPKAVGTKNPQEALLVQIVQNNQIDSIAYKIIKDCFELFLKRKFDDIQEELFCTKEEIDEAFAFIKTLAPYPSKGFAVDTSAILIPDVLTIKKAGKFYFALNDYLLPDLTLSKDYKLMLSKENLDLASKKYITQNLNNAKNLIGNIEHRKATILKISEILIEKQNEFFQKGEEFLKPMVLADVANEMQIHNTTVSRAILNKNIDTPYGVKPFKFFFSSKIGQGENTSSSNAIKNIIKKIIDSEPSNKPYSDQRISELLKLENNLDVARRTVAKYRQALNILPASLRAKS